METDDESRPANIQAVATPTPANQDEEGAWSDEEDTSPVEDSGKGSSAIGFLSLPRRKKIVLLSVGTAQFCVMCDVALLSPLYPIEADKRDVSGTLTGWVFGVFALTQFFVSPFLGRYMRTIGPKFAYVAGALLTGGCTVLLGSLDWLPSDGATTFLALSFVLQMVMACGVTSLQTSAYVLATREFSDNVNFVFGLSEAFVGLGLTAGPEIAGSLYQVGGFYLPFVVMGSVTLLTIPFNLLLIRTPPAHQSVAAAQSNAASRTLRHPSTWVIVIVTVMGGVIWGVLEPSLEPHLSQLDLEPEMLGLVFLLLPAIYSLCCPLVGWLSEKVADGKYVILPGLVMSSASLCLLGPASFLNQDPDNPSLWLNVGALVLHGVAMSLAVIPTYSLLMCQAREACEGEDVGVHSLVAGLWCSAYAFGEFVGPVYGGVILDTVGFADGLTYVALACLAVAVLVVSVGVWTCIRKGMRKRKKKVTISDGLDENSPLLPEKKPPSPPTPPPLPPPPAPPLPPAASAGQQRRKKRERSSEKRPPSLKVYDNEAVFALGGRKTPKFSLQRRSVISPPPAVPPRSRGYQGGRKTPGPPSQRPTSAPPLRESVPSLLFQGSVAVLDASP